MSPSFIPSDRVAALLEALGEEATVLAPIKMGERWLLRRLDPDAPPARDTWAIGGVRTVEPLKALLFPARERVAMGFADVLPPLAERPVCVVGVKACDLAGLAILDKVFLEGEYADPHYRRRREGTIIVSADCTCVIDTCFCTALHGRPHPTQGFDLNLAEVSGGLLVEPGSNRGRGLATGLHDLFREATAEEMAERDRARQQVAEAVRANVRGHGVPDQDLLEGVVQRGYESPVWKEEGGRCVECGACNAICPTCHCFLLADQSSGGVAGRLRLWDSCLIKDFARVAGGANPRPYLWMRLRNRFEKKFDFFPKTASLYACTGCGRCISACPGRIDIRTVLKGLVEHVSQREPVSTG